MAEVPSVKKSEPAPIDPRKVCSFIALLMVPIVLVIAYFITAKTTISTPITVVADKVELKQNTADTIETKQATQENQAAKSISTTSVTQVSELVPRLTSDSALTKSVSVESKELVLTQETNSLVQQVEIKQHTSALPPAIEHTNIEQTKVLSAEPDLPKVKKNKPLPEPSRKALTIARTVLTSGIRNREPVDNLGISIRSEVTQTLYLFSEIRDMAGQTLTHRWLLNGTEMASVNLNVGGIRWRTYSRKTITPTMVGLWRVELLNSKGDLLSVHKFDYYH